MSLDFIDDKSTLTGATRQQAIAWANVYQDLCHHMVSIGHNTHMQL